MKTLTLYLHDQRTKEPIFDSSIELPEVTSDDVKAWLENAIPRLLEKAICLHDDIKVWVR